MSVKIQCDDGRKVRIDETKEIFRNFLKLSDLEKERYVKINGEDFGWALGYWKQFHATQQDGMWEKRLTRGLRTYLKNRKSLEN